MNKFPENVNFLGARAILYEQQKRYKEAKKTHERAYELDRTSAARLVYYARLLEAKPFSEYKNAEKLYLEAAAIDGKDTVPLSSLAALYENMQDYARAKVYYKKVLALEPQNTQARSSLTKLNREDALRKGSAEGIDTALDAMKHVRLTGSASKSSVAVDTTAGAAAVDVTKAASAVDGRATVHSSGGEGVSLCIVCGKGASSQCGRCNGPHYCTRECQVAHWKVHKSTCGKAK